MRDKGILQGRILRPMRIVNTDQEEYCGLVQTTDEGLGNRAFLKSYRPVTFTCFFYSKFAFFILNCVFL